MSVHHDAANWASKSKVVRARIRAAGQVQPCVQWTHAPGCPGLLDLDLMPWDAAHLTDLADGGGDGTTGPAWRPCNRQSGGRRGAAIIHARQRQASRMRAW